ncbi:MAG: PIN domain-containing protein [Leptolyngbyaceae cyanobacterium MO_188.B28]|nr:PIN domain-containing protein [Leptolyngbyaceae cyanobacterium MO_188.B28]
MKTVFADTGYWIALVNPNDELHQQAKSLTSRLMPLKIMTSEMVLTELLNAFSGKGAIFRQTSVQLTNQIISAPEIEIIPQTSALFKSALELYEQRSDQAWSHTDCTSFLIMQQREILEALAHDKHFEQAGFIALLRQ